METQNLTPSQQAASLRARILAGESVPLDELKEFIITSNTSLEIQRKTRDKPSDVDFF
jgi:predicted nucleotidyltransferase